MNLYIQLTMVSSYSVLKTKKMPSYSTEEFLMSVYSTCIYKSVSTLSHTQNSGNSYYMWKAWFLIHIIHGLSLWSLTVPLDSSYKFQQPFWTSESTQALKFYFNKSKPLFASMQCPVMCTGGIWRYQYRSQEGINWQPP